MDAERPDRRAPRAWLGPLAARPATTPLARVRDVLRRTAWMILVEFVVIVALTSAGLNVQNAGAEEIETLTRRHPSLFLLQAGLLMPILEETLFRGIPSHVSDLAHRHPRGGRWILGTTMAVVFAAAHNLVRPRDSGAIDLGRLAFSTENLPISQFLFGLLLWDFARRHGLWASIASHALHNTLMIGLALLAMEHLDE